MCSLLHMCRSFTYNVEASKFTAAAEALYAALRTVKACRERVGHLQDSDGVCMGAQPKGVHHSVVCLLLVAATPAREHTGALHCCRGAWLCSLTLCRQPISC